jgi:hypothetical protein
MHLKARIRRPRGVGDGPSFLGERRCLVSHIEFEEGEILAALTKRGAQLVEAPGPLRRRGHQL